MAVVVLVLSLGGPLSGAGVTLANKLWLALMHVAVGATLIPLLARTSPRRSDRSRGAVTSEHTGHLEPSTGVGGGHR